MQLHARIKKVSLTAWQKIILAMILGIITGFTFGPQATVLKPIGILFLNGIQMMIVPVVFTAIVCAVLAMEDLHKMRRVSIKALIFYGLSMIIASIIGLTTASLIKPGNHFPTLALLEIHPGKAPTLIDIITGIIPANPVAAFASGNILQILVFAIILGICINLAKEKGKPVADFFKSASVVAIKLTQIVMYFAPVGIFALMACVSGEYGLAALIPLMKFIGTFYLSCALVFILFYSSTLAMLKINPFSFFKGSREALLMAFSTSSSTSTLPITMRCAENNLGIPKNLSGFLLPLGTSLNLNGLSVYLSVATVFTANIAGVDLSFSQYLTIILTILLTAMGAGGVPGSTLVVIGAVLHSVGLPLSSISLIASVDRLNDMASTTTNVAGDLYAATLVAKTEGELTQPSRPKPNIVALSP